MDRQQLRDGVDSLISVAQTQDRSLIIERLVKLVPEYIGQNNGETQS